MISRNARYSRLIALVAALFLVYGLGKFLLVKPTSEPAPVVSVVSSSAAVATVGKRNRVIHDTLHLLNIVNSEAYEVAALLKSKKHPDYDVIIDVGTYDGADYTIPGYKLGYTVFSFELDVSNQKKTLAQFAKHELKEGKDFTVIEVAPGSIPKVDTTKRPHIYFFKSGVSNKNMGVTVGNGDVMAQIKPDGQQHNAAVVRIDDVVGAHEKVYIFKMDTQGHEFGVLDGAPKLMNANVKTIQLEFWPQGHRENGFDAKKTLDLLYNAGFDCFDYKRDYMPVTRPSEMNAFTDFIDALPRSVDPIGAWVDMLCFKL